MQVNGWAPCRRSDTLDKMYRVFWRMLRRILQEPFYCQPRAVPKQCRSLPTPTQQNHLVWTRRLPRSLIIFPRRGTAISDDRERDHTALGGKNCTRVFLEAMVLPIFPKRPRYPEYPRASKLARQLLQLLATKMSAMMRCPKAAHA